MTSVDTDIWWNATDFSQMELITGLRQTDFASDDGYQDFVDACNTFWNQLDEEEKTRIREDYY
jgi:hypothetical protein